MRFPIHTRRLMAGAFVGAAMMMPMSALAQDPPEEPDQPTPRERAREEARAERAREVERAAREAERGARQAEREARVQAERALERAAAAQQGDGVFRVRPAGVLEMKPQTYLGVSTQQVTAEAAAQAEDVPTGVGLVVNYLDEEGPAAQAGLEENDVLVKMDDQWLVNPAQLTVLIRMHKAGDEASFTVLREGEEQEIEVELGEKELPVMRAGGEMGFAPLLAPGAPMQPMPAMPAMPAMPPQGVAPLGEGLWLRGVQGLEPAQIEEINKRVEEALANLEQQLKDNDIEDLEEHMQALRETLRQRQMDLERLPRDAARQGLFQRGLRQGGRLFMNNEDVTLRMLNDDGEITIVVQDADGETIYEGPYPDDEELSELPGEAQDIIKQAKKYLPTPEARERPDRPRRPAADDEEPREERPAGRRERVVL